MILDFDKVDVEKVHGQMMTVEYARFYRAVFSYAMLLGREPKLNAQNMKNECDMYVRDIWHILDRTGQDILDKNYLAFLFDMHESGGPVKDGITWDEVINDGSEVKV